MSSPQAQEPPLVWFARSGRSSLIRRIQGRIGGQLGQVLDAEDVLQESLLTAVRVSEGRWEDSRAALAVFLARVAELRLRHEGRRASVRRANALIEEPADCRRRGPGDGRELLERFDALVAEAAAELGLLGAAPPLKREHSWSLFLQEWMTIPWPTASFLLDRPTDGAARSLHHRARAELTRQVTRRGRPGGAESAPTSDPRH